MTKPIARDPIYRKRAFDADIIEHCVRWYITYRLSYRDLVEIMAERGVRLAHSTILRWVTRYVPEFAKRWSRFSKAVGTSWRVDETYVSIKAKWHYLYRAVDKHGNGRKAIPRMKAINAELEKWPNQERSTLWWSVCRAYAYVESNVGLLVNYVARYRTGLPIASSIAESAV